MHFSVIFALALLPHSLCTIAPYFELQARNHRKDISEESRRARDICFLANGTDRTAPCNQVETVFEQCLYTINGTGKYADKVVADASRQQECYCKTNDFFQLTGGCNDCFRLHGANFTDGVIPQPYISMISATFCNSVTMQLGSFLRSWEPVSTVADVSTSNSDVLGTRTEVSLYYTSTPGNAGSSRASPNSTASAGGSSGASGSGMAATPASTASLGAQATTGTSSGSAAAATNTSAAAASTHIRVSTLLGILLTSLGLTL